MALTGWRALVLAAGAGRRFGGAKLLAPIGGVPVIRRTVEPIATAGFDETIVVTGVLGSEIGRALDGLRCRLVNAADWHEGLAASIRAGVAALPADGPGLFLFLGDMPLIPLGPCGELVRLARQSGYAARPRVAGKPGHPVCFVADALPDLMALAGDRGAGDVLMGRPVGYLDTEDDGALLDIDDAEGLAAAERAWKSRATSATTDNATSRGALPKP
jgi:molybdenum cofactor cytidylyltransferase